MSRLHNRTLDAIRGVAAQAVVIGHTGAIVFAPSTAVTVMGLFASIAVLVFFVLSGYVIAKSVSSEIKRTGDFKWLDFAIRRAGRIMPPYMLTIAIVLLFMQFTEVGRALLVEREYDVSPVATLRSAAFAFTSRDAIVLTTVWSDWKLGCTLSAA